MKYILLDSSSILHPIKYALGNSDPADGGIIEGFFKKILELSTKFGTSDIIFCWEGNDKNFTPYRKQIYPAYKKDVDKDGNIIEEEKTEAEIEFDRACYEQFELARKMVEEMGFKNSFSQIGTEADDIMAQICDQDDSVFHDFILCTNDEDMFDCLKHPNVRCFMIVKKKMVTKQKFIEEKNIDPSMWWKVKTIGGCKSDKVPSPKGVAEKTAIKYLNGELKETVKTYQAIKTYPKELRIRNRRLVKIPIPQTQPITLLDDTEVSMERVVKYCYENNMDGFLNETFDRWEKFFGGKFLGSNSDRRKRAEERRSKSKD